MVTVKKGTSKRDDSGLSSSDKPPALFWCDMKRLAIILLMCAPAWGGNLFTDPNCISVYYMENGALTTDSKGSNTLTAVQSPDSNTVDYMQGAGSVDLEYSDGDCFYRADADLSADFPLKNGTTNYTMSFTCWIKLESKSSASTTMLWAKNNPYWGRPGCELHLAQTNGMPTISCEINPTGTLTVSWNGLTYPSVDNWYFVGMSLEVNGTNHYTGWIYVWDDTNSQLLGAQSFKTSSSASTGPPKLNTDPFVIGAVARSTYGNFHDGLMDEVTIWNRVLTEDEFDLIRGGTFGSAAGNNDWWWRRRHNN